MVMLVESECEGNEYITVIFVIEDEKQYIYDDTMDMNCH